MLAVFVLVILIIIIDFFLKRKTISKLFTVRLFNFIWIIYYALIIGNINRLGLSHITESYAKGLVFILILAMNIAFLTFLPRERVSSYESRTQEFIEDNNAIKKLVVNERGIILTVFVLFILISIGSRDQFINLLNGNLDAIRRAAYFNEVGSATSAYGSGLDLILNQWILPGILSALGAFGITLYIKRKIKFSTFFLIIALVLYQSLITAGRRDLFEFIILFILSIFEINRDNILSFRREKLTLIFDRRLINIIYIFVFVVIILLMITIGRADNEKINFLETLSQYFLMPIAYGVKLIDNQFYEIEPLYGQAFFGGIIEWFIVIFRNLFNENFFNNYQIFRNSTSVFIEVLPTQFYNAQSTMLFPFFADGKILGIIFDSFLIIGIYSYIKKIYLKLKNIRSEIYYLIASWTIISGALRWELTQPSFFITLIFIYYFTSNIFLKKE